MVKIQFIQFYNVYYVNFYYTYIVFFNKILRTKD